MQVQSTLEKVKAYLAKSAFASDIASETGKLLAEVTGVLDKLEAEQLNVSFGKRGGGVRSALDARQNTRGVARVHRASMAVVPRAAVPAADARGDPPGPGHRASSAVEHRRKKANATNSNKNDDEQEEGYDRDHDDDDSGTDSGGEKVAAGDSDVANWLNKNFADTAEVREDAGFNIPTLQRSATAVNLNDLRTEMSDASMSDASTPTRGGERDGAHGIARSVSSSGVMNPEEEKKHDDPAQQSPLLPPAPPPPLIKNENRVTYARSQTRKTAARESARRSRKLLTQCGIPDLTAHSIHTPDFDIFALLDEYRRDAGGNLAQATAKCFVDVCMNIFFAYSFVTALDFDVPKVVQFFKSAEQLYGNNPYHNAIHAADVMNTTHIYLVTNNVCEFFSDSELFAVLFAAAAHDLGHLGTNNVFLQNIAHPTAILYNDTSVQENYHTALAFHLLRQPASNFLASSKVWTEALFRDFRACVIDAIWGTDMKQHSVLAQSAGAILADNIIDDHEVPALMRAIVHAADLSNPLKQWSVYMEWAARVVGEFWRQGDEETKRGLKISPMCDRNGANFGKAQQGFISFVVKPWMKILQSVLPPIWLERMEQNLAMLNGMSQSAVDDVHVRIATHAATPLDDTVAQRVMESLRVLVTPADKGSLRTRSLEDNPLLRAKQRLLEQQQQQQQHSGSSATATTAITSSKQAVVKPMSELTVQEIIDRIKASWSEIIRGITSRGSLTSGGAIEQWSRVLLEAHSVTSVLKLRQDSNAMTALTSDNADTVRSALERLESGDFVPEFTFIRTLNITVLDMTRPVLRSAAGTGFSSSSSPSSSSYPFAGRSSYTPTSTSRNSAAAAAAANNMNNNHAPLFVDHYGNNLQGHGLSGYTSTQQHPATMLLSNDTASSRSNIVRFFSEDRPVVVPLESKWLPASDPANHPSLRGTAGANAATVNSNNIHNNNNNTPSRALLETPRGNRD